MSGTINGKSENTAVQQNGNIRYDDRENREIPLYNRAAMSGTMIVGIMKSENTLYNGTMMSDTMNVHAPQRRIMPEEALLFPSDGFPPALSQHKEARRMILIYKTI